MSVKRSDSRTAFSRYYRVTMASGHAGRILCAVRASSLKEARALAFVYAFIHRMKVVTVSPLSRDQIRSWYRYINFKERKW